MKQLWVVVVFAVVTSAQAAGPTHDFSQRIYDAFDSLEIVGSKKFEAAVAHLMIAKESARTSEIRALVEGAVTELAPPFWKKDKLPTSVQVAKAISSLRNALMLNRLEIGKSFTDETRLLRELVQAHLFPLSMGKVRLGFENIDENRALHLIQAHLADPERSLKYDPEIAFLINGNNLGHLGTDGSLASAAPKVKFLVKERELELVNASDGKELAREVEELNRDLLVSKGIPMKARVNVSGSRASVSFEIIGFQYVPIIDHWGRSTLAWGQGNRYLVGIADGLEGLVRQLDIAHLGGNKAAQEAAQRSARAVEGVEDALRARLISGRWYDPTPEQVKSKILKESAKFAEQMKNNLKQLIDAGTPAEIVNAKEAEILKTIAERENKAKSALEAVDKAVSEVMKRPGFERLRKTEQSALKLAAAEKASGSRVPMLTIDRALKTVSYFITAYHVYDWVQQSRRLAEPQHRQKLNEKYAAKVVSSLLYAVPFLGEAAVAVDGGGWLLETTVFKIMDSDWDLPNSEQLVGMIFTGAENAGYWWAGTTRFQVVLNNGLGAIPAPGIDKQGRAIDFELIKLRRALADFRDGKISAEKLAQDKFEFGQYVKTITAKYLVLLYSMSDFVGPDHHPELGEFQEKVYYQIAESEKGYLKNAADALSSQ